MTYYWARFEDRNGDMFRFDTRIYLQPIEMPSCTDDVCIGAIIGKNPGSARPSCNSTTLQPIRLGNDKLLPTVKSIMLRAHDRAGIMPNNNQRKYIQVLNLFYLCDEVFHNAKRRIQKFSPSHPICCSENKTFDFIFYAWGGPNDGINSFKRRFTNNPKTNNHIWYDYRQKKTKNIAPDENDFAKHPQGLRHEFIVPGIVEVLQNSSMV